MLVQEPPSHPRGPCNCRPESGEHIAPCLLLVLGLEQYLEVTLAQTLSVTKTEDVWIASVTSAGDPLPGVGLCASLGPVCGPGSEWCVRCRPPGGLWLPLA